jgi:patatin-related protein
LRSKWLEETDVLRLLAKSQRARAWSKWFLYPMLWILLRSRMFELVTDREVRRKLSTFFRSRWFEAPFDGDRFLESLFDGFRDMRQSGIAPSSLLPPGHVLDLAVSVTDFFGYPRRIRLNTPAVVQEREQSLLWKFRYCHWKDGRETSDFNDDNLPALALAARATSSFPGAFPPVQLTDIYRLLERRSLKWTSRAQFISRNFKEQIRAGIDPEKTSFVDGSIVNDKPFRRRSMPFESGQHIATSTGDSFISIPIPGRHLPRLTGRFPPFCRRWRLLSLKFQCMSRSMGSWHGLLNSTSR